MATYTIDNENSITAFAEYEDALNHRVRSTEGTFASEKELSKLSAEWPISRFVEVWNSFAGVVPFDNLKPLKKFTDRKTAVGRIWKAIQALAPAPAQHAAPVAPKKAKATKRATKDAGAPTAREGSKKAIVLELIRRADGASIKEIMDATQWRPHSVRGFISGSLGKKMALSIESFKRADGGRAYREKQYQPGLHCAPSRRSDGRRLLSFPAKIQLLSSRIEVIHGHARR